MSLFDGDVAIITGAAQGLGAAYATAMAREGARVVAADVLDPEPVAASIAAAGGTAMGIVADVADADSVAALAQRTVDEFGRIDVLVNNAALFGNLAHTRFEDIEEAEWDAVMRVNVRGMWLMSRAVVPVMRRQHYGKIVNIASTTALKGTPMMLHYVSSKGAVIAMTRAMAREVGEDNICVNAVAPGLTLSESVVDNGHWSEEWIDRNAASRALKRRALPEDLVGSVLFLASRDADFMTGQTMAVDGGAVAH